MGINLSILTNSHKFVIMSLYGTITFNRIYMYMHQYTCTQLTSDSIMSLLIVHVYLPLQTGRKEPHEIAEYHGVFTNL